MKYISIIWQEYSYQFKCERYNKRPNQLRFCAFPNLTTWSNTFFNDPPVINLRNVIPRSSHSLSLSQHLWNFPKLIFRVLLYEKSVNHFESTHCANFTNPSNPPSSHSRKPKQKFSKFRWHPHFKNTEEVVLGEGVIPRGSRDSRVVLICQHN